tara:strand:+ start:3677 stop:3976 length:300 start_codon:yes stop_codon:yes gene_type:complete
MNWADILKEEPNEKRFNKLVRDMQDISSKDYKEFLDGLEAFIKDKKSDKIKKERTWKVAPKIVPQRFKTPEKEIAKKIVNAPPYIKTAWGEVKRWIDEQ